LHFPGSTQFIACLLLTASAFALSDSQISPFPVADKAQLFIDQTLVHDAQHVAFTLHPGMQHPRNPLVQVDKPWEGWRLELYGTVLFDEQEKLYKMWYLASDSVAQGEEYHTCYATSTDGIAWEKPPAGTIELEGGMPSNVVANVHLASVTKDMADPDPARRYKMLAHINIPKAEGGGAHVFVSPDGLKWTQLSESWCIRASDVLTGYYDRQRKQYVAFPKLVTRARGHIRRCFGLSTSTDFLNWTEPYYAFKPDLRDDAGSLARIEAARPMLDVPDDPTLMRTEFYGIGAYQAESCTIAFPWVFTINNNARYGNHEGPAEIQLAVSRDLVTWERPFRQPVIPPGESGSWNSGFITTPAEAILVNDEVRLYYSAANFTHGNPAIYRAEDTGRLSKYTSSIGLVTWQRDRFVSADGHSSKSKIETVPIAFEGNRLELNVSVKKGGAALVEFCDAGGKIIATSAPISGDNLRTPVKFEKIDLNAYTGKSVVLRFRLDRASLYSFAFRR
jgi:hypothetical protein